MGHHRWPGSRAVAGWTTPLLPLPQGERVNQVLIYQSFAVYSTLLDLDLDPASDPDPR